MNKSMMWIAVVVALLVGIFGGYMYAKSQSENEMMMVKQDMQKQIDAAKMESDKMMQQDSMKQDAAASPTEAMMHDDNSMKSGDSMSSDQKMGSEDKMMPSGK
jgi:uncharacterized membrane-anchored protein YhcB (DUF1043 family)